ncbi:unnamed protein product [Closterium sp. NIES-53]
MHRLGSILRTVRSVRPITAGHGALSLRDVPVFGPNTSRLPVSFLGREISSVVPVADAFAVSNAVGGSNGTYLSSRRVAVPTSLRSLSGLIPSPPATGYALRAGRGELVRAFASKSDAATGERDNDGKGEVSSGRGSSGGGGEAAGKELRGEGSDGGSGGAGGASDVDFMAAVIIDEGLAAEVAAREQTDKWKDLLAVPHVGKSRFVNPFPFLPLLPAVASSTPSPHPALFPLTHHSFPSPTTPSPHPPLLPLTHHSHSLTPPFAPPPTRAPPLPFPSPLPPHCPLLRQALAEELRLDAASALALAMEEFEEVQSGTGVAAAEMSVLLCTDACIRELNNEWRGVDAPTDVLSFPQDQPPGLSPLLLLGDVIISVETAQRQANERGHSLLDELRILMVTWSR